MIMIEQLQYIVEDGYENYRHNNVIVYDVIHLVNELNSHGLVLIPEVSSEYSSCSYYNLSVVRHVHSFAIFMCASCRRQELIMWAG